MPRARSMTESANTRRMAPYWLSGIPTAIDEDATRDAVERGILSEEEIEKGFYVPKFSGIVEGFEDGSEVEQVCVLVGYLTWEDHEEYVATFGEELNTTTSHILQVEGVLAELQAKEIGRLQRLQEMEEEMAGLEKEYINLSKDPDIPQDEIDAVAVRMQTLTGQQIVLRQEDYAAMLGVSFMADGTVVLPNGVPVRRRQKIMDLMGFCLSRCGRIVGVKDEWFNIRRSTKRGLVSPTVFKKCFEVEPITQKKVLELIMPETFMQPLRVEETTREEGTVFREIDRRTPLWDILALTQLYSFEEQEAEMKGENIISEEELKKSAEETENPLSSGASSSSQDSEV